MVIQAIAFLFLYQDFPDRLLTLVSAALCSHLGAFRSYTCGRHGRLASIIQEFAAELFLLSVQSNLSGLHALLDQSGL